MDMKEFKETLQKINADLKDRDFRKATNDSYKVSFGLNEVNPTHYTDKVIKGYKVNLDTKTVIVEFRSGFIEQFVANLHKVTAEEYGEMKKFVFKESLFRAYSQFLAQSINSSKEGLLPVTPVENSTVTDAKVTKKATAKAV